MHTALHPKRAPFLVKACNGAAFVEKLGIKRRYYWQRSMQARLSRRFIGQDQSTIEDILLALATTPPTTDDETQKRYFLLQKVTL
jgi:hypothetical protein